MEEVLELMIYFHCAYHNYTNRNIDFNDIISNKSHLLKKGERELNFFERVIAIVLRIFKPLF